MKWAKSKYTLQSALAAGGLLIGGATVATAANQSDRNNATKQSQSSRGGDTAEQVKIKRATNFIGSDVIASDGQKVGDIVDYIINVAGSPELSHVVIMTGGFLDMGGEARAVPASAVRTDDGTCRIDISSSDYWDVPVLPDDRTRFLSAAQNRERIQSSFTQSRSASNRNPTQSQAQRDQAQTQSRSQEMNANYISFALLRNADIYGANGDRLGFCVDAWVNLDNNRLPLIEINPTTFQPFRTNYDLRYAIPVADFKGRQDGSGGYTFDIRREELDQARPVSDAEGVKMLQSGFVGDKVLQVRLAQR